MISYLYIYIYIDIDIYLHICSNLVDTNHMICAPTMLFFGNTFLFNTWKVGCINLKRWKLWMYLL